MNNTNIVAGSCPKCAYFIYVKEHPHPALINHVVCPVCAKVCEVYRLREKVVKNDK